MSRWQKAGRLALLHRGRADPQEEPRKEGRKEGHMVITCMLICRPHRLTGPGVLTSHPPNRSVTEIRVRLHRRPAANELRHRQLRRRPRLGVPTPNFQMSFNVGAPGAGGYLV